MITPPFNYKEAWKSFISNGILLCILIQTALKSLTPVERQQRFIYRASKKTEAKRLQNNISVYRAELTAIILLLSWVNQNSFQIQNSLVIFSDSLSALQAIQNSDKDGMIIEILFLVTQLHYKGINIFMEWIPGHCGIKGNDIVDCSAKAALFISEIDIPLRLNKTEIKSLLRKILPLCGN